MAKIAPFKADRVTHARSKAVVEILLASIEERGARYFRVISSMANLA